MIILVPKLRLSGAEVPQELLPMPVIARARCRRQQASRMHHATESAAATVRDTRPNT